MNELANVCLLHAIHNVPTSMFVIMFCFYSWAVLIKGLTWNQSNKYLHTYFF